MNFHNIYRVKNYKSLKIIRNEIKFNINKNINDSGKSLNQIDYIIYEKPRLYNYKNNKSKLKYNLSSTFKNSLKNNLNTIELNQEHNNSVSYNSKEISSISNSYKDYSEIINNNISLDEIKNMKIEMSSNSIKSNKNNNYFNRKFCNPQDIITVTDDNKRISKSAFLKKSI